MSCAALRYRPVPFFSHVAAGISSAGLKGPSRSAYGACPSERPGTRRITGCPLPYCTVPVLLQYCSYRTWRHCDNGTALVKGDDVAIGHIEFNRSRNPVWSGSRDDARETTRPGIDRCSSGDLDFSSKLRSCCQLVIFIDHLNLHPIGLDLVVYDTNITSQNIAVPAQSPTKHGRECLPPWTRSSPVHTNSTSCRPRDHRFSVQRTAC